MASSEHHLSHYDEAAVPHGAPFRVAVVVSEWNQDITSNLLKGAKQTLLRHHVREDNLLVQWVPGAFELPLGCQLVRQSDPSIHGIIAIGCVIQGETQHFDFVCQGVTQGIMRVQLDSGLPIAFCVLTDRTKEQSIERSGGKHGNKGIESAITCLKMMDFSSSASL